MATIETLDQKFSEICRLCLKQDGVMASIFQTDDDQEDEAFSLAQRISTIARVQIDEDDGLPSLICNICRHQVEKSYNFRLLVEISDRTLRNCLEIGPSDGTCEEQIIIKQECLDKNIESTDEENIELQQLLLQNNLTNTAVDPSGINFILVQSEDGTQVLNICSLDDAVEDNDNSNASINVKNEYAVKPEKPNDPISTELCEQDESRTELDDLEGIRQLLNSEKIYVQALESEIQSVYSCTECNESEIQTVYSCTECNEIFSNDDQLNDHFSTQHAEHEEEFDAYDTDICCQLCFKAFATLSDLKNHITEHFNEHKSSNSVKSEADAVETIAELSETVENLLDDDYRYILEVSKTDENHLQTMPGSDLVTEAMDNDPDDEIIEISNDTVDENSPKDSVDLELNLEVANDTEYKSDIFYCVKKYLSESVKSREITNFPCTQCDKVFTQKHEHTLHLRRHLGVKPFKCTSCDKTFITNALKKEHERSHTGDKSFVCVVCGKSFFKKSELKYHEGVHTDTPSTCTICNKEFTNVQSFKMHTKRHILGSRYVCETCGKSYYTNSELARHIQMHSGKREYPCHLCQTSFLSRPELNRHLKYHIGEKKFRCKICFKSYFESGHLKIHERVHTGEKPYTCTVCNKAFVTKPKLVRHGKTHMKELMANIEEQHQGDTLKAETIS